MKKCWCGNEELAEYSEKYFRCDRCHTLVSKNDFDNAIYNVQDEGKDLYGKNYWEVLMTRETGKNSIGEVVDMYLTERVPYWVKYILKYTKPGDYIAEVGCGLGQLQYIFRRLGFRQMAFELSPGICSYIENQLGVTAHCGSFQGQEGEYDAIIALDLFEHLTEPLKFLEECSKSLKEEGFLCFQTPCYDSELSYDEMMRKKGRFEKLLEAEQHVYLYSRNSIIRILRQFGFEHIKFEPAFFGDDYDMFLFASKREIKENTEEEINAFLNSGENGRLVKAILTLAEGKSKIFSEFRVADRDRKERLDQNNKLKGLLERSEEDRCKRGEQIEKLTQMLKESETDRENRGEQIEKLTQMLKESEADRTARLEQIETLSQMLQESEKDRADRLNQINTLTQWLNDSQRGITTK